MIGQTLISSLIIIVWLALLGKLVKVVRFMIGQTGCEAIYYCRRPIGCLQQEKGAVAKICLNFPSWGGTKR